MHLPAPSREKYSREVRYVGGSAVLVFSMHRGPHSEIIIGDSEKEVVPYTRGTEIGFHRSSLALKTASIVHAWEAVSHVATGLKLSSSLVYQMSAQHGRTCGVSSTTRCLGQKHPPQPHGTAARSHADVCAVVEAAHRRAIRFKRRESAGTSHDGSTCFNRRPRMSTF